MSGGGAARGEIKEREREEQCKYNEKEKKKASDQILMSCKINEIGKCIKLSNVV